MKRILVSLVALALCAAAFPFLFGSAVAGKSHMVTLPAVVGVTSVTLNPSNVAGGKTISGKVTLSAPAPAGGAVVALSDNVAATNVPASVTVSAGTTSKTFTFPTVITPTAQSGTLTASYNGSIASAPLTVRPAILNSLKLTPGLVMGSKSVSATVTLDGLAPATGAVITLSDTLTAAATPVSVTIPSGAVSKNFVIPTSFVDVSQAGSVTAKFAAASVSAPLTIRPVGVSGVALTPDAVTGGSTVQGLVVLEARAPKDIPVTLTDNLASASAPATITVPAGATSQSFTVKTNAVTATQGGVLTAAAAGGSRKVPFTVERALVRCTGLGFGKLRTYPSQGSHAVVAADFNNDNKIDLAVLTPYKVSIMLGTGAGDFGEPTNVAEIMVTMYDLAVGDFNQDGNRDLAVSTVDRVAVLLGNGQGGFSRPTLSPVIDPEYGFRSVVVADINGDGIQDLAVVGIWTIFVMPGNGLGAFTKVVRYRLTSGGGQGLAAGDFNNDGNADLVQTVAWYVGYFMLGSGTGAMGVQTPVTDPPTPFETSRVTVGDFNKDGYQDLAFTQLGGGVAITLGTGKPGKGAFLLPVKYAGAGDDGDLLVRDMNGDLIQDLVTVNPDYTVSILRGDGTGKFKAPVKTVPVAMFIEGTATPPVGMKASDFNGDGRLDIVGTNYWGGTISVLLSNCL